MHVRHMMCCGIAWPKGIHQGVLGKDLEFLDILLELDDAVSQRETSAIDQKQNSDEGIEKEDECKSIETHFQHPPACTSQHE